VAKRGKQRHLDPPPVVAKLWRHERDATARWLEDAARDEHQVAQAQASRRPATNVRTIGTLLQTADTVAPV
jgi:hypothetical protein